MKIVFMIILFFVILSCSFNIQAEPEISEPVLQTLKNIGVNVDNTEIIDVESVKLKGFNDYATEDNGYINSGFQIWNTFLKGRFDKVELKIKASSVLKGYPFANLLDKKAETAWVEGVNGDGIGEWFLMNVTAVRTGRTPFIRTFGVIPGYSKSDKTWEENNRVKSAILVIHTLFQNYYRGEQSEWIVLRLKFDDKKCFQIFTTSPYQKNLGFYNKIWFIIEDVYKGTKYPDTCVSEVYISGAYPETQDEP